MTDHSTQPPSGDCAEKEDARDGRLRSIGPGPTARRDGGICCRRARRCWRRSSSATGLTTACSTRASRRRACSAARRARPATPGRSTWSSTPPRARRWWPGSGPCKRCRPLDAEAGAPEWAAQLVARVEADPGARITDADLRAQGLDPAAVRRWFKKTHGMTFQAYCRARRLGDAFAALRAGDSIDEVVVRARLGVALRLPHGVRQAGGGAARRGGGGARRLCRPSRLARDAGRPAGRRRDRRRRRPARVPGPAHDRDPAGHAAAAVRAAARARRSPLLERLRTQLGEYFAGGGARSTCRCRTRAVRSSSRCGTPCWRIPYGETRSYAELARELGVPGAARAVGRANGANRIAIVMPCHRVIAADGGLGGYGGGLWRKLRLLETEGAVTGSAPACAPCGTLVSCIRFI